MTSIGVNTLNEVIGSHPSITYKFPQDTRVECINMIGLKDLRAIKTAISQPLLTIIWDTPPKRLLENFQYIGQTQADTDKLYGGCIIDKLVIKDTEYKSILFLHYKGTGFYPVAQYLHTHIKNGTIIPHDKESKLTSVHGLLPRSYTVETKGITIYTVEQGQLRMFMQDQTISFTVKVLSIMYNTFPSITEKMMNKYIINRYSGSRVVGDVPLLASVSEPIMISAVCCLLPAYSQISKIPAQINKRLTAMLAGTDYPAIPTENIASLVQILSFSSENIGNSIIEAIGWICAIDKNGDISPATPVSQLMDPDSYLEKYEVEEWIKLLLIQLRLVYTHFQCSSINFALVVLPLLEELSTSGVSHWAKDIKALNEIKDTVTNCPYINCVHTIPENRRIAAFPSLVYIGVLYRKQHLQTEAERSEFQNFAIMGATHHFADPTRAHTCEVQAKVLPAPTISSLALLGSTTPPEKMENIVTSYDDSMQSAIYEEMKKNYPSAPWVVYRRGKYKRAEVLKTRLVLIDIIEKKHQEASNYLTERIMTATTDQDRTQLKLSRDQFLKEYLKLKNNLVSIEDQLHDLESDEFKEDRQALLAKVGPILQLINNAIST